MRKDHREISTRSAVGYVARVVPGARAGTGSATVRLREGTLSSATSSSLTVPFNKITLEREAISEGQRVSLTHLHQGSCQAQRIVLGSAVQRPKDGRIGLAFKIAPERSFIVRWHDNQREECVPEGHLEALQEGSVMAVHFGVDRTRGAEPTIAYEVEWDNGRRTHHAPWDLTPVDAWARVVDDADRMHREARKRWGLARDDLKLAIPVIKALQLPTNPHASSIPPASRGRDHRSPTRRVSSAFTASIRHRLEPTPQELQEACRKGDVETIERAISSLGADIEFHDGSNPVVEAAKGGSHQAMGVLARARADLDRPVAPRGERAWAGAAGQRAVHVAAASSQPAVLAALLRLGADVEATDELQEDDSMMRERRHPLPSGDGSGRRVRFHGVPPSTRQVAWSTQTKEKPSSAKPTLAVTSPAYALHYAVATGSTETVVTLLKSRASPCVVDGSGATPAHIEVQRGNSDVLQGLIQQTKATAGQRQARRLLEGRHGGTGDTPLLQAARLGNASIVATLLRLSADHAASPLSPLFSRFSPLSTSPISP